MTTYDGHRAYFIPGANSGRLAGAVLSASEDERRYAKHRSNVMRSEPKVETHLLRRLSLPQRPPVFRDHARVRANVELADRLDRIQESEGFLLRERRRHLDLITAQSKYSLRVREMDRRRRRLRIEEENAVLARRLDVTHAVMTHRASSGGTGTGVVRPQSSSLLQSRSRAHVPRELLPRPLLRPSMGMSPPPAAALEGVGIAGIGRFDEVAPTIQTAAWSRGDSPASATRMARTDSGGGRLVRRVRGLRKGRGRRGWSASPADAFPPSSSLSEGSNQGSAGETGDAQLWTALQAVDAHSGGGGGEELLLSWPVSLPGRVRGASVHFYYRTDRFSECLTLRLLQGQQGHGQQVLCEEELGADLLSAAGHASTGAGVFAAAREAELTRALLVKMFHESDLDHSQTLSLEELRALLLLRMNFSIGADDLRALLGEANLHMDAEPAHGREISSSSLRGGGGGGGGGGTVNLREFLPFAAELLNAYQAREAAAASEPAQPDEQHLKALALEDLDAICALALAALQRGAGAGAGAGAGGGSVTAAEFCLLAAVSSIRLSANEIRLASRALPRDPLSPGKLRYDMSLLREALFEARMRTARRMLLESRAGDLESYLLRLLRDATANNANNTNNTNAASLSPKRLLELLLSAPRLSLTRLQAVVLVEDARYTQSDSDSGGEQLDVYHFASMASRAIGAMFSRQGVADRALLLETSTSTSTSAQFEERLMHMFKEHDRDGSGELDFAEFSAFLHSIGPGGLSGTEVKSLWNVTDTDGSGTVSFSEFAAFCSHNLEHLQREKQVKERARARRRRSLVFTTTTTRSSTGDSISTATATSMGRSASERYILAQLEALDEQKTGLLEHGMVRACLAAAARSCCSARRVDVILCEVDGRTELVDYLFLLSRAGGLIDLVLQSAGGTGSSALEEAAALDARCTVYAAEVCRVEVDSATALLATRLLPTLNELSEPLLRKYCIEAALRGAHAVISRCEANWLFAALSRPVATAAAVVDLTWDSLRAMVAYAKELSLLRRLVVPVAREDVLEHLTGALTAAAGVSSGLGADTCIEMLESLSHLDLPRCQLVALLAASDCFELNASYKDAVLLKRPLAYFLSKMFCLLHDEDYVRRRSLLSAQSSLTDVTKLLAGPTRDDAARYLRALCRECGALSELQLWEGLEGFPSELSLEREQVLLIAAALSLSSQTSRRMEPSLVEELGLVLVLAVRTEAAVMCRMPLMQVVRRADPPVDREDPLLDNCSGIGELREEGVSQLKMLAARFVAVMEVTAPASSEGASGIFRIEAPLRDKSHALSKKISIGRALSRDQHHQQEHQGSNKDCHSFRRIRRLPVVPSTTAHAPAVRADRGQDCLEVAIDASTCASDDGSMIGRNSRLFLSVLSEDGRCRTAGLTPFLLPSLACVDGEVAEEFVDGLLTSLYLEEDVTSGALQLRSTAIQQGQQYAFLMTSSEGGASH